MAALTPAELTAAMKGRLIAPGDARLPTGFSIDSRTLAPGDLFFAIVAARDGHDFVADALARDAVGIVVSRPVSLPASDGPGAFVIEVADTTCALQDLARYVRRQSGALVVAITGSVGKTTTKDATADFLSERYRVVKNSGNLNNHLGLPLSLLDLRHGADVAVMELGMNHAGEIRVLVDIADPEVRVWTNVGDAHIGHFGSIDALADAKAEILEGAGPQTLLVANADDARVMARAQGFPGRAVTFGLAGTADVRSDGLEDLGIDGSRAHVTTRDGQSANLQVPLVGRGHLANVLCATAVALELGVDLDAIVRRAAALRASPRRGAVLRLPTGVTVVDDSYNSSPSALKAALAAIAHARHATRRIAVIGEMLELGDLSTQLHEECGQAAAAAGLSWLVTVGGPSARALGAAAIAAGLSRGSVSHYATSAEAAVAVVERVAAGDVVLVKGSRGTRTDLVVDRIAAVVA